MKELEERLVRENRLPGHGTLKVDSFLNHQIDPELMMRIGRELANRFQSQAPTKVLTVETSGIAPSFATAVALHIPVIVARRRRVPGMPHELLRESTLSPTLNQIVEFFVSPEFLTAGDRVLVMDAFMTSGQTLLTLARLAASGNATVVGVGTVIERQFEGGRQKLLALGVPIESLVKIKQIEDGIITFARDEPRDPSST
jgi:xanthine phosphoribosyltransferase